jgi:protein-L-isoaspartate(D-aspartate) O-methyltransferase
MVERLAADGIGDRRVLELIRRTPRHIFVDEALASRAYEDIALPIGFGQTISQPYIVARMTEALLRYGTPDRVLEIGTGSGYQTAILAQAVNRVYSVERIEALQRPARRRFQELKLRNIRLRCGDGYEGWSEYGPYDGIVVTAAPPALPEALPQQLALGARLIIPVGRRRLQQLLVITRTTDGYERKVLELVKFVPLVADLD